MRNLKTLLMLGVLAGLIAMNTGCPFQPPSTETLDNIDSLPDEDGDGFVELDCPEGSDASETIAVAIVNEITRADAEALAGQLSGFDIPPGLTAGIGITVNFSITRVYEGGVEFTDRGSRGLESFEIRIEACCPDTVIAAVDVVATVPILGNVPVLPTQTFTLSRGAGGATGFECGKVISVTASLDAGTGQPDVNISIEDQ